MTRILIVAGEASADRYGARLVQKVHRLGRGDGLRFFGTGGDEMHKAGVEIVTHVRDLASIGPGEAIAHFRRYYDTFQKIVRSSLEDPPAVAVLLDFPEFNLRLAKKMKQTGAKVLYYISPQLWAWRGNRIRTVRRYVDRMLVILPFEEDYYRKRGVCVDFVGHPLLEDFSPNLDRNSFLRGFNLDPARRTVALLPGSRNREVHYILPTLIHAARLMLDRVPAQFLISAAPSVDLSLVSAIASRGLQGDPRSLFFKVVTADSRDVLSNADFAFVKSGTSTLEAALAGTPFVIVYKISNLSWYVGNILIRSPFKGLVNLIAGEQIVPEFMQADATPEALAQAGVRYLEQPESARAMRQRLLEIREKLGARCASDAAAQAVDSLLSETERLR